MLHNFFELDAGPPLKRLASVADLTSHFDNSTTLDNAIVDPQQIKRIKIKGKSFRNVKLSHVKFLEVTFEECTFEDCLMIGTQFDSCEFHRCGLKNCNTWKYVLNNTYLDPLSFSLDKTYRTTASNVGVDLYQKLYDNAQQSHQSLFAASSDILRRRWRRYQWIYDIKKARKAKGKLFTSIIGDFIYDKVATYGYGPIRFLLISLFVFLCLSVIVQKYWSQIGFTENGSFVTKASFVDAAYYTLLLTSSLGLSNILPSSPLGKVLALVLAFTGITWVGLFTAILVRRLIR
jgi:ion channel/pentapeptide repeat protein